MVKKLKKRILAVSYAFPPWLAPRSIQVQRLLNFLSMRGHEITVLRKNIEDLNVPMDPELDKLSATGIEQIDVKEHQDGLRWKIVNKIANKFSSVPDPYNSWAVNCYNEGKKLLDRFDVLMTFSTPISDHIAGVLLKKRRYDIPWIACFSDPFIGNPYWKGRYAEKIMNNFIEKKIVKNADSIIFVNDYTRRRMMEKFPSEMMVKSHVIPHGFEENLYTKSEYTNKKLIIRHMGEFYGERTPETLFRAIRRLARNEASLKKRLSVEIYCSNIEGVKNWIAKYEVRDFVTVSGLVTYAKSLSLMKSSDVLLVIDAPAEENLFLTSKLIDYVGAKKPILAITPQRGPTAELMMEMGFKSSDFYDVSGIEKQIRKFLTQKEEGGLTAYIAPRVYNRFRMETIGDKYFRIINSMERNDGLRNHQSDLS